MDPETSKSWSRFGYLPGVRQTRHMPSKSVIGYTVVFNPPEADGSVLGLTATRRRLWQFTECGSFSRPSVGTRRDDPYPQKRAVPRV